jgi:hypothetical protein
LAKWDHRCAEIGKPPHEPVTDGQPSLAHAWAEKDLERIPMFNEPRQDRREEWSIDVPWVSLIRCDENAGARGFTRESALGRTSDLILILDPD